MCDKSPIRENSVEDNIEIYVGRIMEELCIPVTDSNKDTPKRIAKMLNRELFVNRCNNNIGILNSQMKMFPNEYKENEMVIVKDIPFSSMCEHHWLPMVGTVSIGYVPSDFVLGLSKFPRVVKYFSRQPQLQEHFTQQIGNYIFQILSPVALFVEVNAEHMCVKCRGIESDCNTTTFYKKGDERYYREFRERLK